MTDTTSTMWSKVGMLASIVGLTCAWPAQGAIDSRIIGHGSLLKGNRIAAAKATATSPKRVSFRVTTRPTQRVKIYWSIVCASRPGAPAEKEGSLSATTPVSRALPLPLSHAAACLINVDGVVSKPGTELIQILQD